jgi:hypothetical protein
MRTFDQMKDTIYDTLTSLSLVAAGSIEYQNQNSPHPALPYFALDLNSFLKIGRDAFTSPDAQGKSVMIGNREFTLMVLGFGDGIVEKTHQLQTALENPAVHDLFLAGELILVDIDQPIQDISGLDESENEERSSYDIIMRTESAITDIDVGLIKIINATGTFEQEGKNDIVETLNVDSS